MPGSKKKRQREAQSPARANRRTRVGFREHKQNECEVVAGTPALLLGGTVITHGELQAIILIYLRLILGSDQTIHHDIYVDHVLPACSGHDNNTYVHTRPVKISARSDSDHK